MIENIRDITARIGFIVLVMAAMWAWRPPLADDGRLYAVPVEEETAAETEAAEPETPGIRLSYKKTVTKSGKDTDEYKQGNGSAYVIKETENGITAEYSISKDLPLSGGTEYVKIGGNTYTLDGKTVYYDGSLFLIPLDSAGKYIGVFGSGDAAGAVKMIQ